MEHNKKGSAVVSLAEIGFCALQASKEAQWDLDNHVAFSLSCRAVRSEVFLFWYISFWH